MKNLWLVLVVLMVACGPREKESNEQELSFSLSKTFPHNMEAFTQGLTIYQGKLFESTGQEGNSWIAEVDLASGTHTKKVVLEPQYFGEGITILNNKVYQLTWKNKKGFVYRLGSFEKLAEFDYNFEGWGITSDGAQLIVSDGSEKLRFLDTLTFKVTHTLTVTRQGVAQRDLNELEFVEGFIFANQWQTNNILKIDPATGEVAGVLNLGELAAKSARINPAQDVLNGIAYEPNTKTLLVTGKFWPVLFALRLVNQAPAQ